MKNKKCTCPLGQVRLYFGNQFRLLHLFISKVLLVSSLDDLCSSYDRRFCESLTSSELTNRTGFVKLLFETLQRFFDRFVLFYVYNDHSIHLLSGGKGIEDNRKTIENAGIYNKTEL